MSGKIDWPTLIADGESIALKTEREPDQARQSRRTNNPATLIDPANVPRPSPFFFARELSESAQRTDSMN